MSLFNFFRKPKKSVQEERRNSDDFLILKDKKEIKKLAKEEEKHLKIAKELDEEIMQIQKSAKTLVPSLAPLHHDLRQKYRWYYRWHANPYAKPTHWLILLLLLVAVPLFALNISYFFKNAKAATYDFPRWEWVNPTPTGNNLSKVDICNDGSLWAVGASGTIIKSIDSGNTWEQVYTGTGEQLNDITCITSSNIITVGRTGTIIQYNGVSWTQVTSGTYNHFGSVAKVDSTHVLAVGSVGQITALTYNGSTWSAANIVSGIVNQFESVVTIDSTHALAVGDSGQITALAYNGSTWSATNVDSGTFVWFFSVAKVDSTHALAVGESGQITALTYNGSTWSAANVVSGTSEWFDSIATIDSTHVLAVGSVGQITALTYNGSAWEAANVISGTGNSFNSIVTIDSTHVLAVGSVGQITALTYNGSAWSAANVVSGASDWFTSVIKINTTRSLTVGVSGQIATLTYNGSAWSATVVTSDINNDFLTSIGAVDSTHALAVGGVGKITAFTYNGSVWEAADVASGTGSTFYSVAAADSTHALAVGASGTTKALTYNGSAWEVADVVSGTANAFDSVTVADPIHALAVGDSGQITALTYNGSAWEAADVASGTANGFNSIAAADSTHALVVGASGTIKALTYNGSAWSVANVASGTTSIFYAIAVINSTHVLAVGASGQITALTYNGSTWSAASYSKITTNDLRRVAIFSSLNILTTGVSGTILHYHSPANATATKLLVKLPGQDDFADGNPITGTPTAVRVGDNVTATIYAVDAGNVLDKGNASYAGFSSTDPNDTNPGNIQLTEGTLGQPGTCIQNPSTPTTLYCGRGQATFVFHTPGTWTVTAADVYGVLSSGTSSTITVNPGAASKLSFTNLPSSLGMGTASSAVTLQVKDAYNNNTTVSGDKTVRLSTTSSGGRFATSASGPWSSGTLDLSLTSGQGSTTFYYLDFATNTATITASETPDAGWTDASGVITVTSGSLDQSTLTVDKASVAVGESLTAQVTVKNNEGLALASRTVSLSSSKESDEISSAIITDANGQGSFTIKPTVAGQSTLTAFDQTDNAYIPDDVTFSAGAGGLAQVDLTASSSSVNAGSPLSLSLTCYDSFNNVVSDFNGSASFSSSDTEASFDHVSAALTSNDSGRFSQNVTLNSIGEQTITASVNGVSDTVSIKVLGQEEEIPGTTTTTSSSPSPSASALATPTAIETLLDKFSSSPIAQEIAKVVTPIATAAAAVGILPLLVQAFPQGFHIFASLFPALFTASKVRRRRKPWGFVFDSLSNKPLELAIVRIYKEETDKLVATKVTDTNGRFNMLLNPGTYYLKVTKAGFSFPAKMSKLKSQQLASRFGPGADIYTGQPFVIEKDSNVSLSIALDPKEKTLPILSKTKMYIKEGWDWALIGLSYVAMPMMLIGAVFAIISLLVVGSVFHLILAFLYALLMTGFIISRRLAQVRLGLIFDDKTRKPITNAVVSVFDAEYKAIRETKMTDKEGHFAIFAPTGEYYLIVEARGYQFPSEALKDKKEDKVLGKLYHGGTIHNRKASFLNVSVPMEKKY